MIVSWKHKGLKKLYLTGDASGIIQEHKKRCLLILDALNRASVPERMNFPGSGFHKLKGDLKGFYAVTVKKNWRIIFRFKDKHALDVNYLDYH